MNKVIIIKNLVIAMGIVAIISSTLLGLLLAQPAVQFAILHRADVEQLSQLRGDYDKAFTVTSPKE